MLEEGKSVKKVIRFPDLPWHSLINESCISKADAIDLTTYIIQLNNLIDQYEAMVEVKEEGE